MELRYRSNRILDLFTQSSHSTTPSKNLSEYCPLVSSASLSRESTRSNLGIGTALVKNQHDQCPALARLAQKRPALDFSCRTSSLSVARNGAERFSGRSNTCQNSSRRPCTSRPKRPTGYISQCTPSHLWHESARSVVHVGTAFVRIHHCLHPELADLAREIRCRLSLLYSQLVKHSN